MTASEDDFDEFYDHADEHISASMIFLDVNFLMTS